MDIDARSLATQPLARRVRLNSIWLLLARLITQGALILSTVLIARALGVIVFGQYAYVAALIALGNVATTFGTDTLLIREVARDRHDRAGLAGAAVWLQLALSASWLIVVALAALTTNAPSSTVVPAVMIYSLSLIPLAFFTVYTAVLRAHERMDVYLLISAVVAVTQLIGIWAMLQAERSLLALVIVLDSVQLLAAIVAALACRHYLADFRWHWPIDRRQVGHIAHVAWPFALLGALAVIYQRLGVLMLSSLGTNIETGWYAAASRVIEPVKILHFAVLGALLPALAKLTTTTDQPHPAARLFRRSWLFLLSISGLVMLAVMVFAAPLVAVLFGAAYLPAAEPVRILAVSLIPYTISAAWSVRRVTQGQERRVTVALAASLAMACLFNLWLIPLHGANGAALTVVIGKSIFAVILLAWKH
jgi:O-antigen/teichoic acid export membrane protein